MARRLALLLALALVLAAAAASTACAKAPAPPQVTLAVGTILTGSADTKDGIARWQGVRYAQAPTGKNRYAPPQIIDEATQNSAAVSSKKTPQAHGSKHGHYNAAISLRPMPFFTDAWHYGRSVINGTHAAERRKRRLRRRATTVDATKPGPKCAQDGLVDEQDEDCLYANIHRPLNAPTTPLPVIVFIHGGAFQTGAGSDYDPTAFMKTAMNKNLPVVFVTFNYRLNIFGFFGSSDLADLAGLDASGCTASKTNCTTKDAGSEPVGLNLGFQDMKMAINWTYSNIAAFGGDPTKITIWGQSAGAFGVGAQLVGSPGAPLGTASQSLSNPPRPLFRGAIFQSGAPSGYALALPSERDGAWISTLTNVKCIDASGGAQGRLNCLRNVPWQALRNESLTLSNQGSYAGPGPYILGGYPWSPVADGGAKRGGFFASAASEILEQGNFAQVPIVTGNNLDEGTIFVPHQFDSSMQFEDWTRDIYFANITNLTATDDAYNAIALAYPDNPAVGSPYAPANNNITDRFYPGADNQYKRLASFYGDIRYHSNRRFLLQQGITTKVTPAAWTYLFQDRPPKAPVDLGVPHSSDLDVVFGFRVSPLNAVMQAQYAAFATNLNPNAAGLPEWPQYDLEKKQMLMYVDGGKTALITDDYRETQMEALNSELVRGVTTR